jgi:cytochrome c-type biogenesis protein CcmF
MTAIDLPFLGNLVLCLILVSAAYTLAMAVGAARGRPNLLAAARSGTYATASLVALAVFLLAYAFQTHDFRLTYVARYSDRSMPWWYLLTSLWGGQDGSLLWWTFLLSGYTVAVTHWMRGRYFELQPYVLATLMSIFGFFLVIMLFAANPFATYAAAAPIDGEGLNPLLQNYWMVIHPPSLYMGFVGFSVPFAIVVGALLSGRLTDEWLKMARPWAMIAWMFLSLGLILGCLWSYEELGWGGYWAWDPVENASFMPWLVATAYLHSALVQERYGMLKVWNVFLLCLTFFMTIFGTFLTRSGLIASVHSFARSDIGIYFVWYLGALALFIFGIIAWRLPKLRAQHRFDSLVSREFAFLLNNWILLLMMAVVLVFTTAPLLSEWLLGETITMGPDVYNTWMAPIGLILLFLAGAGPLIAWRKSTGKNLARAFVAPVSLGLAAVLFHVLVGPMLGFPPVVDVSSIYDTATGDLMAAAASVMPVFSSFVCAFLFGSVAQEFWRGARVRMKNKGESLPLAIVRLTSRARRRYGGYIVHVGVALMFVGFTGAAYDIEDEAALMPGATMSVGGYDNRYDAPRMEVDPEKRMVFTDVTLLGDDGQVVDRVSPAKFIYRQKPDMPTTEVAIRSRPRDDLYVIMSTVDPATQRATFRVVVRPFVAWIWFGGLVGLLGAALGLWPHARDIVARAEASGGGRRQRARLWPALTVIALAILGAGLIPALARAQSDASSSLHAGTVIIHDPEERQLFSRLLCQCGDCARLPLDTCACGWAEAKRAEIRGRLAVGETPRIVQATYRAQYGAAAISVPADEGFGRALWAVPLAAGGFAAAGVVLLGRRFKSRGDAALIASDAAPVKTAEAEYDARLDDELNRLEDE